MRGMFTRFAIATCLLLAGGVVHATQYPPGPANDCPDSVTVKQIQDATAICHPATGDTVYGVGGIVTGFDPIATGFGFYIQNSQGGPFTGIDVFTHGTNYQPILGLAIGDSVVVEVSKTAEFNGGTEIFATNNNFSSPNIVLRKVSSGHALPPFFEGTTTQLRTLSTNATGEEYEGCLVGITASMAVARTYLQNVTGGTTNLPFGTFYVVDPAASGDSVLVDGATLFAYAPPAVGTPVTRVQGILEQRNSGTTAYRIQLRSGNDIVTNTPPGVNDAYCINENEVRVIFDRDVTTTSAANPANYSLGSFGNVDAAVMDGQDKVILTISSAAPHGDNEVVTINGVVGLANGVAMTAPSSRTFVKGVLSCAEMSAPNPDTLALSPDCYDQSIYSGGGGRFNNGPFGTRSTFTGIVLGRFGNLFYMGDAGAPQRGGITVFAPPAPLVVGNRYTIAGAAQEFIGETEYAAIQFIRDEGAVGVPAPVDLPVSTVTDQSCDMAQTLTTGEDYESMLVRLVNVRAFQRFVPAPTNGFHVRGLAEAPGDTIFIQNLNNVLGTNDSLNANYARPGNLVTVVGVVHQDGSFRVCPRSGADITIVQNVGVTPEPRALSFSVYPNPARKATLAFTLPQATDVELGVYDVSGRRVAEIFRGSLPAGDYTRGWAGRDDAGRPVGAGVFFVRLTAGGETRMTRTVILGGE